MFSLRRLIKNYDETGSLNEQISPQSFIDEELFVTKTGDIGAVLEVRGVDFECLDDNSVDGFTKRLESALRLFDEKFRVYQYIFRANNQTIPHREYGNPVVDAAIHNRITYLASKADRLFSLSIYYVVLFEGFRYRRGISNTLAEFPANPLKALRELSAGFSTRKQIILLDQEISKGQATLRQKVAAFILQVSDFLPVRLLNKHSAFRVLYRTLNLSPFKVELATLRYDTFLDCQLADSSLECHRGHLRVDDYYVKVLTLKEPSAQSFPLILKGLLEVDATYFVVTEWKKEDSGKTRRTIQAKRRHFHNTKRSFRSQVSLSDAPQDVLLDDSKESQVRELGESIKELELKGNHFGEFSLTIVLYGLDLATLDRTSAEFYKVFSVHDARLTEERLNLLNAFLAVMPGNYPFNLRRLYLLNPNYADFSFLFTLHCGEPVNAHLRQEYLAVLETNHHSPYFLNLHYRDVAHTIILGRTGAGKTMKLEEVNKRTKEAVDFLVAALESGHSEVLTAYLGAMAKFHTYSFGNVMLIARQKPDATNVAGLRTWNSLGRFVKRGEKGIFILAPMIGKKRKEEDAIADADGKSDGDARLYGFRAVYVFDVTQTEGKDLPALTEVNGDVGGYRERLFKFVESQSVDLSFSERIAPAKGLSHGGKITLLSGMQPAEEFSTLVHEIAHEMLHRGERRTMTTKQVRETEAEAVAFVVCQSVGLQNGTASQDYIQLWHGDANLLRESLEAVQQTAAVILGGIAPEPAALAAAA